MIILGIDPGTAITGYGVIQHLPGDQLKVISYGAVTTPAKQDLQFRLKTIFDDCTTLNRQFEPDAMAIEKLFFNTNTTTAMSVGQARGVIMLSAALQSIPVYEYTPLQIKMALTGYGRADKTQVQQMVTQILKLPEIPKPDDVADGLAAAITHAFSYQMAAQIAG